MSDNREYEQSAPGKQHTVSYNVLRRLQEHSRSDLPALLAQRAMGSFTLHREPPPSEATDYVYVMVFPQDPFVGKPQIRRMSRRDIHAGLMNSRVRIEDVRGELAQPDEDGHFLYLPNTPQFEQVNAFYYTTFTLRMFERYARRAIPWSFPSPRLLVNPHVGDQANAFYNEQDHSLGFHSFLSADGTVHSTAQSADIVSHEAAHAVLDGVRDLYNESFGLGPRAFHESFSDIAAVLVTLHDDSLVHRLLEWTKEDLHVTSFASEVAEHVINFMPVSREHMQEHTIYLRNAFNTLKNAPFDDLQYFVQDPSSQLARQEHNYSRLFTGAFYDMLIGVYDEFRRIIPAYLALYRARDVMGYMLMTALELGPVGEFDFSDMARAFLTADQVLYDGQFRDVFCRVFDERVILSKDAADQHVASLKHIPDVKLPKTLNSALAAALFLEELSKSLSLPDEANLIPLATYRNARGYAYLTYFMSEQIQLAGEQYGKYNGTSIHLFGGLTLMFDSEDRLRSVFYRPVVEEDRRQIRILTSELIQMGLVTDRLYVNGSSYPWPAPQGLWIPDTGAIQDRSRLVKFPVIVDKIPDRVKGFVDYLREWRHKG